MTRERYDEILTFAINYAKEQGYVLNPYDEIRDITIEGLAQNMRVHGKAYCPCRFADLEDDKAADKIACPCAYHREEIEEKGLCHCGLFMKPETAEEVLQNIHGSQRQFAETREVNDLFEGMRLCYEMGWTDGLPVIPPTESMVSEFLDYVNLGGSEIIGTIPPRGCEITAEKVAANAVMAGCLPEYMPVVLAAVKAVTDPRYNLHAASASTGGAANFIVVNGPIAKKLNINSGPNVFGPGWRSNATIGRAVQLVLRNVGRAIPGQLDRSTLGNPGKYTLCIAEYEEISPWEPLSRERGFPEGASTVSVFATESPHYVFNYLSDEPEKLLTAVSYAMTAFGNYHNPHGSSENVVVICPEHAKSFAKHKWSKEQVRKFLFENCRRSVAELKRSGKILGELTEGDEHVQIPLVDDPKLISIVVAGGDAGGVSGFVPGWAGGRSSRTVTVEI